MSMKEGLDPTSATDEFHTWKEMQPFVRIQLKENKTKSIDTLAN